VKKVFPLLALPFLSLLARESHYCLQLSSSKKLEDLIPAYEKVKDLPDARLEKIENYYALRVGKWEEKAPARKLLKRLEKDFPDAFVRRCYHLPERIVLPKRERKAPSFVEARGEGEEEITCKAVLALFKDFPKGKETEEWSLTFVSFYPYSVVDALNHLLLLHQKEGFVPLSCRLKKEGDRYELRLRGYRTQERLNLKELDYASLKEVDGGVVLKVEEK